MKPDEINKIPLSAESVAERYLKFLGTPYVTKEGDTRQPAKTKFIELLRTVHAAYRPRFDLSACINGRAKGFRGKVWFWSDLHLSHTNIIGYCNRPFIDSANMNERLIQNCLSKVSKDDILVFGGDLTINDIATTNAFLHAVPAYTILVLGNHDVDRRKKTMLDLKVDEVAACLELELAGQNVFVSHYPIDERLLDPGQLNLHGHIHTAKLPDALGSGVLHVNMSVEHLEYQPKTLDKLIR